MNIWTNINLFAIVNKLCANLDVNGSFTVDGILVKIWLNEVEGWERFHITTTVGTAQTFLNISTFLLKMFYLPVIITNKKTYLESSISSNWTSTGLSGVFSDLKFSFIRIFSENK